MIKVISLDFWGTIATYNPQYVKEFTKYIADFFNIPVDDAYKAYKTCKDHFDQEARLYGTSVSSYGAICVLGSYIRKKVLSNVYVLTSQESVAILQKINELVAQYPPFLSDEMARIIKLAQSSGFIVGLTSNTNYIGGDQWEKIYNIPFDFEIYSGEMGFGKPSKRIFNSVIGCSSKTCEIKPTEIIHIGDNQAADVDGAINAGLLAALVSGPSQTIEVMNNLIKLRNGQ